TEPSTKEIWVAKGFYTPGPSVTSTFELVDGVNLIGGFAGNETDREARDWRVNSTNLTGNIGGFAIADNCWHVITAQNITSATTVDGFVIRQGFADGSGLDRHGAGFFILDSRNIQINSCLFDTNQARKGDGAGVYIRQSRDITFSEAVFGNNTARGDGGGVYIGPNSRDIQFFSSTFAGNTSSEEDGGAIGNFGPGNQTFSCLFYENTAKRGGAIYNGSQGSIDVWHGTLTQNTADDGFGSAVYSRGKFFSTHSIYWDNTHDNPVESDQPSQVDWEINFSIVEGGWSFGGGNNKNTDPLFRDPDQNRFTLLENSPGIDVSNQSFTYVDLLGNPRVVNGKPDMGAYEFQTGPPPPLSLVYVDQDASGADDGSSWEDAFEDLQDALAFARTNPSVREIWVAEGVYTPTSGTNSSLSFELVNGIGLLGGFEGDETESESRNPASNLTVLSGEIGGNSSSDNTWHVLRATDLTDSTLLDGFTIVGGYADGSGSDRHGGGLFMTNSQKLVIQQVEFSRNRAVNGDGGAIFTIGSSNSSLRDVLFQNNQARGDGGAIYLNTETSSFLIDRAIFQNNKSTEEDGGAIAIFGGISDGKHIIANSLFFENESKRGGAIYIARNAAMEGANLTFTKNEAPKNLGSAINARGQLNLFNSILWDNSDESPLVVEQNERSKEVSYSIIEGGFSGTQILDLDPEFTNASDDDYTLALTSPAIDQGIASASTIDLAGNPRLSGDQLDLGAFEQQKVSCSGFSRLYVDTDATGSEDGSTWDNSFVDLQEALSFARSCDEVEEIWIAKGTYFPSQTANTDETFMLVSGVSIYGGFSGSETAISQRDINANETILSGFIDCNDDNTSCDQRSDVVVVGEDLAPGTIIDGLTITGGNNGQFISNNVNGSNGAGMILRVSNSAEICEPTLQNLTIRGNRNIAGNGGGLFISNASPVIDNCLFTNNFSVPDGGGIYVDGDRDLTITNTTFSFNSCDDAGGAIAAEIPNITVENCVFYRNFAETSGGGGIATGLGTNLIIRNSTFHLNRVDEGNGGALKIAGPTFAVNSIFWRNGNLDGEEFDDDDAFNDTGFTADIDDDDLVIEYSIVELGWPGEGNLDMDPAFVDGASGDLRLTDISPAINAGLNAEATALATDLDGNPRLVENTIDMGAYEFQETTGVCPGTSKIFVDINSGGLNDGSSWSDAFSDLQDALALARSCDEVTEIWVAEGTYTPTSDLDDNVTFLLVNGVSLYGGFSGTESSLSQRDWKANPTILSGDLGQANNNPVNSKHVVVGINVDSTTLVDGFIIRDGSTYDEAICFDNDPFCTDGIYPNGGGGILIFSEDGGVSNPIIQYCLFENNQNGSDGSGGYDGGAIYLERASATIQFCEFMNNSSGNDGGAISAFFEGRLTIKNSVFKNNVAGDDGGAIYVSGPLVNGKRQAASVNIENSEFYRNSSFDSGGAIFSGSEDFVIRNATFFENTATEFGTINVILPIEIYNSIIWLNESGFSLPAITGAQGAIDASIISHSIIEGGFPGTNNLSSYPEFVDTTLANLDLSLTAGSPAINAGLTSEAPLIAEDLAGNIRVADNVIDIGAYEFQDILSSGVISFLLINSDTDNVIGEVRDGDVLTNLPGPVNIEAVTTDDVKSVKFQLSGPVNLTRTENVMPWALFGDSSGDFRDWDPLDGNYTLTATPFSEKKAQGEEGTANTISFTVDVSQSTNSLDQDLISLYPNPTQGSMILRLPENWKAEGQVQILNKEGIILYRESVTADDKNLSIELTGLQEGLYYLLLKGADKLESTSFIITN
ncbi:MAG: choice-of-anchor Q domain-containing protein, partial [Bacteroidota bacterium]